MEVFKYKAILVRVVDGDTMDFELDLGFNLSNRIRVRLAGINTAETWRPQSEAERVHGKAATEFVESKISVGQTVYVKTYKNSADIYNRYTAMVYYESEGKMYSLTEELLKAGFEKKELYEQD